jgi:hypothetical protein
MAVIEVTAKNPLHPKAICSLRLVVICVAFLMPAAGLAAIDERAASHLGNYSTGSARKE